MGRAGVQPIFATDLIAACARNKGAAGSKALKMPTSGAKKRRRQKLVKLCSVVIKGLLVKRLFLTEIREKPSSKNKGCPLGYSVICFAKRRLVIRLSTSAVPCTLNWLMTGMGIDLPAPYGLTFSGCFDERGLKSRQINNLQRNASETHYRGSVRCCSAAHGSGQLCYC